MYSLAVLVTIILSAMLFSGPIAIGLTFIRITNPVLNIVRRVIVCLFGGIGIGLGVVLIFEAVATAAKVLALAAITAGAYAIKREFSRK
jgi:uncharacterized protein YggT (Ycf19 family)